MKFLLIALLAAVVVWLWRSQRRGPTHTQQSPSSSGKVTDMVACDTCQVHLPRTDALINGSGTFCSEAHRRQGGA